MTDTEAQISRAGETAAANRRWQMRLVIAIPAILVLFILAAGVASLEIFDSLWPEIEKTGAAEIATRIQSRHLAAVFILAVLGGLTGLAVAYAITRPILALDRAVRGVASGRLDTRISSQIPAAPEFGDLSRSFNGMIEFVNRSIEERNRFLLEGVASGVLVTGPDGRVTGLNSTGARILGVGPELAIGRTIDDLRDMLPGEFEPLWSYAEEEAEERTPLPSEIRLDRPGGARLLVSRSAMRDPSGAPGGVVLNFRDAAEIRELHERLTATDRLAALGTFTMGLAHELRNPLASIKGVVQILRSDPRLRDSAEALDHVVRDVNRIDRFIGELLDLSRGETPRPPEPVEAGEILRRAAARAAAAESGARAPVEEDFGPGETWAMAEPERLERALVNILRNAHEAASEGGGRISLGVRRSGPEVLLRIHNTGSSIPSEDLSRIFEPFHTTKERGTGLGLAIARQIAAQQGGSLEATSGDGWVCFTLRLTAAPPPGLAPAPSRRPEALRA